MRDSVSRRSSLARVGYLESTNISHGNILGCTQLSSPPAGPPSTYRTRGIWNRAVGSPDANSSAFSSALRKRVKVVIEKVDTPGKCRREKVIHRPIRRNFDRHGLDRGFPRGARSPAAPSAPARYTARPLERPVPRRWRPLRSGTGSCSLKTKRCHRRG